MRIPCARILAASSFSTLATSDCCAACSSTHSRTTFCSARIWRTSWLTPWASSFTASSAPGRRCAPAPTDRPAASTRSATARCMSHDGADSCRFAYRRRRRCARRQLGDAGQPFLELVVEPAVGVAGLQLQEAQHERAGEAEQRRRERRSHALQRRGQAGLQVGEHGDVVGGAGVERADGLADRLDGLEQAPEGAEQAEEHQQADHIAAGVARLIEPASRSNP